MRVFDDKVRTNDLPANHLISAFEYLNDSARVEAQRVRNQVTSMFERYPKEHQNDLFNRLRSKHDITHQSAFFELALHELLVRQNFAVKEIEPTLANGKAPDFLVEAPDRSQFYLEATLATGQSDDEASADRRVRQAIQAIDEVRSPDFFLSVSTHGTPSQPVAIRKLGRAIQNYIDNLDYDYIVDLISNNQQVPLHLHKEHGLHITITVFPKNTRGNLRGRAIGGGMLPGGLVNPHIPIRTSVKKKAPLWRPRTTFDCGCERFGSIRWRR